MSIQRLALTAALLTFSAGPLFAARPPPQNFPPIGLGIGQTLRLSAVASDPGLQQAPAAGCDATLSFADRNGNPTGPAPLSVSLMPGQAAFLDMPSGLTRPGRVEVEPVIAFPAAGGGTDCDVSVELFDQASGFSSIFSRPPPQNLPGDAVSFSLMGLGIAQVAQLNAIASKPGPINTPPGAAAVGGPCVVTLGFVDAAGTPVGAQPGPVQIAAGQTTSAYFLSTVRSVGARMSIRPVVTVDSLPGMEACAGVTSIVETWDLFTDRTWAIAQPILSDFAISVSPSAQNVSAGTVVNFTVNTSVVFGVPGTVLLTATLPSGVFAAFAPGILAVGGSATMAVAVSAMAQNGLATVTVVAKGPSGSHTANAVINISGGVP